MQDGVMEADGLDKASCFKQQLSSGWMDPQRNSRTRYLPCSCGMQPQEKHLPRREAFITFVGWGKERVIYCWQKNIFLPSKREFIVCVMYGVSRLEKQHFVRDALPANIHSRHQNYLKNQNKHFSLKWIQAIVENLCMEKLRSFIIWPPKIVN